jgi:alpha-tubulin suppressor-like RCC1 family protein
MRSIKCLTRYNLSIRRSYTTIDSKKTSVVHLWGQLFMDEEEMSRRSDRYLVPQVMQAAESIPDKIVDISLGSAHMCAVTDRGHLYAIGENFLGQCAQIPKREIVSEFTKVDRFATDEEYELVNAGKKIRPGHDQDAARIKFKSVACGKGFTMAIAANGADLFSCGCNDAGQLGIGYSKNRYKLYRLPLYDENDQLATKNKIKKVACGAQHTIILYENGELLLFGSNVFGQLGNPDPSNHLKPKRMQDFTEPGEIVENVECGLLHTVFLTNRKRIYATGRGYEGQLGIDVKQVVKPVLIESVNSLGNVTHISCGYSHSVAVIEEKEKLSVYTWGNGFRMGSVARGGGHATVGLYEKRGDEFVPRMVLQLEKECLDTLKIASGAYHSILHSKHSGLFAGGQGSDGQLGNGERGTATHQLVDITENFEKTGYSHKMIQSITCGFSSSATLLQKE